MDGGVEDRVGEPPRAANVALRAPNAKLEKCGVLLSDRWVIHCLLLFFYCI